MHVGNVISNNKGWGVLLNVNSTAQVSGAMIQFNAGDGILLQSDSKLVFFADFATTSSGNGGYGLRCPDAKSSVVGLQMLIVSPPNAQGGVSPGCTGF
jgi:hypothetical protein